MPHKFVHLHAHSHYSLLEALPKIGELVKTCEDFDMDTLALTDNGVLYGAIEYYQKMTKAGKKPIIGMDAYVAPNGLHQKRARIDKKSWRLVLLAENNEGYYNLLKLSSTGFLEGFYYKPRIDDELLKELKSGLICLSGGYHSELSTILRQSDNIEKAKDVARRYKEIFGRDHYFLEIVDRPELAEQQTINSKILEIGKELDIQVVVTKDASYLKRDERDPTRILACVAGGRTLEEVERTATQEFDASLVDPAAIEERFKDVPEVIENTRKIADRCNIELTLGEWNFPDYKIESGRNATDELRVRTMAQLHEKYPEPTKEVMDRIDYELDIIDMKGFSVYYLIVSDFLQYAKRNGIVTTVRGSAAGSIVGYIVDISNIDPLYYQLPFERFLNPQRPSAPDVDADFADNRRDEVLKYVTEKYGVEKVAQICTFGKMLARGSVRDTGRALGFPYDFVDSIAKLVPMGAQGMPMTLDRALDEAPELKQKYDTDAQVRRVINMARKIEGCARHVSVHAAGTVVSPTELTDYTPLQRDNKEGKTITQYDMHAVEAAGLIKFDFLGIRNLSILGDAVKIVKRTKNVDVDLQKIPTDDTKTFELLTRGETMGVFQLGSDGMTKYLMELKPTRVEDIMAMVALYRPGPIEFIPEYIKRKHHPETVDYPHEELKEILEKSLGLLIYQDDVMLTAIKLAGYSWLEADKFRKAMGKKIPELMVEQEKKFKDGFVENGYERKLANNLWERIKPFAMYAFNKAHSASYGMVAYQTAYMKANYPAEYMTAIMTAESGDLEKISSAVSESRRMDIEVLGPNINESLPMFTYIDDKTIRFGLVVIKGVGAEVVESIVAEREENGPYVDVADFATRVHHRAFNRKSLDAFIKAGALDEFAERGTLLHNIEQILHFNKEAQKAKLSSQSSMFDMAPGLAAHKLRLKEVPDATDAEKLVWEKELLGLFLTSHPWKDVAEKFDGHLNKLTELEGMTDGAYARVGGLLTNIKQIVTKKGDPMAFASIDDGHKAVEVVIFPRTFAEVSQLLAEDAAYLLSAKVQHRDGEVKLLLNSLIRLHADEVDDIARQVGMGMWVGQDNASKKTQDVATNDPDAIMNYGVAKPRGFKHKRRDDIETVSIKMRARPDAEMIAVLRKKLTSSVGPSPVYLQVESAGRWRTIETEYSIDLTEELKQELTEMFGGENVDVRAAEIS